MKLHSIVGAGAFALALLGSSALTAPAFAANVPTGTKLATDQTFTFRMLDNPGSLDPDLVEDADTAYSIVNSLFEGLYSEDSKGDPTPGVAQSYDVNADNTVYTFHLRDAKWSNGDPIKAGDFVYGWQRAVDPKLASPYSYFPGLVGIKNADDIVAGKMAPDQLGVKAVDDKTLEVDLDRPVPFFVRTTAHSTLFPVPQAVVEKFGNDWVKPENIVGNGAFVLSEYKPGERVTMKRNTNYWDNEHTVLDTENVLTINDSNAGMTRYMAGEVDWTDIPPGQYPKLKAQSPDEATALPELTTYYFDFNMTDKQPVAALKDVRVRQAISYAIDRDVIVKNILQAGQEPAYYFTPTKTAGFVAPDLPYAKMTQADRDAKAKELMTEAGYGPDNPVSFTYIYNGDVGHQRIATAVSQMLKEKLGINMTIQNMEFQMLQDRRHAADFEVARDAWGADYNEASTFLGLLKSDSSENDSHYANADVDKLLEDAATSKDPSADYTKIEEQIAKDVPIIPIYFYTKNFMLKTNVKGWPYDNAEQVWYAKDLYKVAQ